MLTPTYGVSNPSLWGWVGQVAGRDLDERKWTMQEMNTYNVTFAADWGWIGTTMTAPTEDEAIESARDYLHAEAGIPWDVICTMPHVEGEYVGVGVA